MSISAICFASTAVCRLSPGSLQQQVRPGRSGEADVRETINSAQCALKISLNTWSHFRRQFEHHASGGAPVTFRFMEFNLLENMKWLIRAWEVNEGTSTSSTFCVFPARTSLYILSRTWRKYPMRPGLGRSLRSLNPPRRLGGWGDPLGTISKWGRASSHDGDIRALMRPLERCCFFSCPDACRPPPVYAAAGPLG